MSSYAVIDLETTGFSPGRGDRIVEVGVVLLDNEARVEREWTTLVNPKRDIGASHVHGIRARDVVDAPLFGDIAEDLVGLLSGRTLIAHNQAFDVRFLRAELQQHSYELSESYAALCTMLWSNRALRAPKLADACSALGIDLRHAHAALGDAQATATLFAALRRMTDGDRNWDRDVERAVFPLRSRASAAHVTPATRDALMSVSEGVATSDVPLWLRTNVTVDPSDPGATVYLELLTEVLDDGLISSAEHWRLAAIAQLADLSDTRLPELHARYLKAALEEASADGEITSAEQHELAQIATLLDLPTPAFDAAVAPGAPARPKLVLRPSNPDAPIEPSGQSFALTEGCRVVFTGTLSTPREAWVQRIVEAGLTTGGVTKKTAVLVAEDPASQSTKGRTAAKYGVPVVTEAEFARGFEDFLASR